MYEKNLTEDFRLRLSQSDMDFLRNLSAQRSISVSECVRSIIGEYRRSLESLELIAKAIEMSKNGEGLSYGDTKSNIDS